MGSLFLGLDVGTQGCKCIIFELSTKTVLSRGAKPYGLTSQRPGQAEQDPSVWVENGRDALREAISGLKDSDVARIKAIGVSGQQHGLVVLDSEGKVVRPCKLWCDTESSAEAEELSQELGFTLGPAFTATKVMWLQRNEPENWSKTRRVLLPKDYFNYWLTGEVNTEASDSSGTGYYDAAARRWDEKALDCINLPADYLPALVGPSEALGSVRKEVAAEIGLPDGVLVSPGGGDNAMSALAAGATSNGVMVLSLGTSGTLFGYSSDPVADQTGTICPFADCTGAYLPLVCTLNCTEVPEDVRAMCRDEVTREELTAMAEAEPAGCRGLTYIPYLRGERTPNLPSASGALIGLRHGFLGNPGLMYRAALEGVTYSLLAGAMRMRALGVSDLTELRVVGGGARNKLWCQIVAGAFGVPVVLVEEEETAALGAALQAAAVGSGVDDVAGFVAANGPAAGEPIEPNSAEAAAYADAIERHATLSESIWGPALPKKTTSIRLDKIFG